MFLTWSASRRTGWQLVTEVTPRWNLCSRGERNLFLAVFYILLDVSDFILFLYYPLKFELSTFKNRVVLMCKL